MSFLPYIGLLSEYQKEYLDYSGRGSSQNKLHRYAAGLPTLPPPDCRPEEYSAEDGILPPFRGESISKSDYVPQPHLSSSSIENGLVTGHVCPPNTDGTSQPTSSRRHSISKSDYLPHLLLTKSPTSKHQVTSQNSSTSKFTQQDVTSPSSADCSLPKPSLSRPPMLLLTDTQPKVSEAKSSFQPFPINLARSAKPVIPSWLKKHRELKRHEVRYDLTSSYQVDYCGVKTKPRRICLETPGSTRELYPYAGYSSLDSTDGKAIDNPEISHLSTTKSPKLCHYGHESLQHHLHDYVGSLLYRTTTGMTYLPPSAFGNPPCHLKPLSCPAEGVSSKMCKIHKNQVF